MLKFCLATIEEIEMRDTMKMTNDHADQADEH